MTDQRVDWHAPLPIQPLADVRVGDWRVLRSGSERRGTLERLTVLEVRDAEVVLRTDHLRLEPGARLERARCLRWHVPRAAPQLLGYVPMTRVRPPDSSELTSEPREVEVQGRTFGGHEVRVTLTWHLGGRPETEVTTLWLSSEVPIDGIVKRVDGRGRTQRELVGFGTREQVLFGRALADEARRLGFDSGEEAEAQKPRLPHGLLETARPGRWTTLLGGQDGELSRLRTLRILRVEDGVVVFEDEVGWRGTPHGVGPRRHDVERDEVPTIEAFVLGWGSVSMVGELRDVALADEVRVVGERRLACRRLSFQRVTEPDDVIGEYSQDDWVVWLSRDLEAHAVVGVQIHWRRLWKGQVMSSRHERYDIAGFGTADQVEWGRRAEEIFPS